jgi:hypothetical protein
MTQNLTAGETYRAVQGGLFTPTPCQNVNAPIGHALTSECFDLARAYSAPMCQPLPLAADLPVPAPAGDDDAELRARLVGVIGARPYSDLDVLPRPSSVELGQLVWTQGTGRLRRGVVTGVGPKRVEVAYTTASSGGRIYRTKLGLAQLRVDAERRPAPAVEVEAPHYCEPCELAGQRVEAVDLRELGGDLREAVCAAHCDGLARPAELTTVRCLEAFDAAQTVLCTIADLDVALGTLGNHVEADDRLRASILDLLSAMHSVHSTLGTDASIYARHAGIEL